MTCRGLQRPVATVPRLSASVLRRKWIDLSCRGPVRSGLGWINERFNNGGRVRKVQRASRLFAPFALIGSGQVPYGPHSFIGEGGLVILLFDQAKLYQCH
jgi:hypothetical protein